MISIVRPIAIFALLAVSTLTPAIADRAPNREERAAIEMMLTGQGFASWESIELEDAGHWEVDDAVTKDGKKFDLRLKDKTYEITDRKAD